MRIRMMRTSKVSAFIAGALVTAMAVILAGPDGRVSAQTRAVSMQEVPRFEVDPTWPKIPNGWVLGQVASTAADDQDHVWVLHRPRVVRLDQRTGPPVMEFDAEGNYIQGWGGPSPDYSWPESEHGIFVDHKGYVWVGGRRNEDQILKFTRDGTFVAQFGESGHEKTNKNTEAFWRPADVFVYSKTNELFVADGYGNKRIIVFDADTGAYKRMWGAFGNVPSDEPVDASSASDRDMTRIPAKEIDPSDPGPPQFNTVHGVKVSNDGHVYVADRGGKRVQVFTLDGTFVKQAFVDRWCEAPQCGNGQTVASVAFSADSDERFLYVASRSPARIWVYDRRTLQPLDSFGRPGVAPGEFYILHHMTSDSHGNLYVSEVQDGRRVQKFTFKGLLTVPAK